MSSIERNDRASGPFSLLYEAFTAGSISRRQFIERSTALGVAGGVAIFCANAHEIAASGSRNGWAMYGSSSQGGAAKAPDSGTEGQQRGGGGDLRIVQWQAATTAGAHSVTGTKDSLAASLVSEPLMHYLPDGSLIPNLIAEVPSVENGLLAEDLKTVTFNLLEGVTWSDGQPFTAEDVVFTWMWVVNTANASTSFGVWDVLERVEARDERTVVATYKRSSAAWFEAFTGSFTSTSIYPRHLFGASLEEAVANRNDAFQTAPVGTGPFVVESFQPNGEQVFVANETYREPNKPFFARLIVSGGGDAAAAARAVLETGEADFAWNMQVEPAIIEALQGSSDLGRVVTEVGTSIERININMSDPNAEVNGQRSEMNTPHPILSDLKVRQALNLAVPREVIATEFYGEGQPPTANVLDGIETFRSPNTSWEYNLERAGQLLDEAGWVMDGDVRVKDGRELALSYATSINQVRQKTQAVVQQAFNELGIRVQLQQVDAGVFFDGSAGNPQNINHFYWDLDMYANSSVGSPVPIAFMIEWYSGPNGSRSNIAQESNSWQQPNFYRYQSDEYDTRYEKLLATTDVEAATALLIEMNDIVINDVVLIPQVNRAGGNYAIANSLNQENIAAGPSFEPDYWNIANWNRVAE